jgi:phenylacetate-CoA ligase
MSIINKYIYKFGIYFRNKKIYANYKFLKESEAWSRDELQAYQLKKFKELLKFCYENSKYYKNLFDENNVSLSDIKSLDSLISIPILKKTTLLNNIDDVQCNVLNEKMFYSETSGSTGEPLVFYRNQDWDAWHNASVFRGYSWFGINPWDRNGYLWGFNYSLFRSFIVKIQDALQNRFRMFNYNDDELYRFCNKLRSAKYLNGYSSMIYELAKKINMESKFKGVINLKFVKGTSEKIFDTYQKESLEAFGSKIVSEYGAAEAGIIAFECPDGNMHVNMETCIVEEIDNQIIVTNLVSKSFPIIRYELGDYIKLDVDTRCSCGLESHIIKEVTGRVGKNIFGFNGLYPSLTLYYVFKNIAINDSVVLNYQVIQKEKGFLDVLIDRRLSDLEKAYIKREMIKYFKDDISYSLRENANLISRKGKKKDFISEID